MYKLMHISIVACSYIFQYYVKTMLWSSTCWRWQLLQFLSAGAY